MAEATVSYAVQILGDLLIQKLHFLGSVEGEVRRLKDELKRMQCFLKDADEKQGTDERVRNWISEMREVALDSQDVIEFFLVKVANTRRSGSLLRNTFCFPNRVYYVNQVGKEIESIRKRLRDIESSRSMYGIENLGEATSMMASRRSTQVETLRRLPHWQTDKHLVGMESDVELLLQKVMLDHKELRLSSATITGMGGIGKSTLAKAVYKHRAVVDRFERRCWVVVSSELRPKEMMKDLMLQLRKPREEEVKILEMVENMEVHNLQRTIHQRLKDTRYFIVVDDVWEDVHWEAMADAFPDQDNGSRLLLTSRNHVKTKHTRYVHPMKVLNPDESWKLLLKKANIEKDDAGKCPEEVEDIVRQILKKCKGLPLAICVVGGILAKLERQSKTEFEKVLKGINTHLGRSEIRNVSAILELSYQNLPTQLKPCFLCLAFFKEDAAIKAKKLVYIWIALGLIQQEGEETMEEIAMRYLDELMNRNMIQVKEISNYERVKSCGMHDLIRDLSITKAKEEMRFEISRCVDDKGSTSESTLYKARHRVIYITNDWCLHLDQNKHVRSVFIHRDVKIYQYERCPSSYWKSFELLRILDLESINFKNFPEAICGLIELRYLGILCKELPPSIGKLKNLVVLYLGNSIFFATRIPNVLWKMDSLRHLYTYLVYSDTPLKLNTLKNMQTLKCIILKDSEVEQVSEMTSLWKLGIRVSEISNGSKLFTSLAKLQNLSCLKLTECNYLDMEGLATLHHITQLKLCQLKRLPTNFPPNLSHLSLYHMRKRIAEEEIAVLGKLPKLLYLNIHRGYCNLKLVIPQGSFPMLQVLDMWSMNVWSIEIGKGAMSKLKRLNLGGCGSLKRLPQELKEMKNLEELIIPTTIGSESDVYSHLISNLPSLHVRVNITT